MRHWLELKGREHACVACMRPQDYHVNIITRQDEHLYSRHSEDRRGVRGWLWPHKSEASPDYISPYIKKKKTEQQNTQEMNKLAFLLFNTLLSWFDFYIKKKKKDCLALPTKG